MCVCVSPKYNFSHIGLLCSSSTDQTHTQQTNFYILHIAAVGLIIKIIKQKIK